jgi:hypothetical protein
VLSPGSRHGHRPRTRGSAPHPLGSACRRPGRSLAHQARPAGRCRSYTRHRRGLQRPDRRRASSPTASAHRTSGTDDLPRNGSRAVLLSSVSSSGLARAVPDADSRKKATRAARTRGGGNMAGWVRLPGKTLPEFGLGPRGLRLRHRLLQRPPQPRAGDMEPQGTPLRHLDFVFRLARRDYRACSHRRAGLSPSRHEALQDRQPEGCLATVCP